MNEEEIKSLRLLMFELVGLQTEGGFKNTELSRRERIKERSAYLRSALTRLTKEEMDELDYCEFLVEEYYPKNPIV